LTRTLTPESLGTAPGRGRLTSRRIVVVGAGTRPSEDPDAPIGNGRAIAVLCAREGADVACVDIDRDAAQYTAGLCEKEGVQAAAIEAEVRDAEACAPGP
jgi:NAD(P)-dependent dehydrogenase (short-subunit alcohol dehydrogenase family)